MNSDNGRPESSLPDGATHFFAGADEAVHGLRAALDGTKSERIDDWRAGVIRALRSVIESDALPAPSMEAGLPGMFGETPENSALHYRIAWEIIRHFRLRDTRDDAATLSRGMLLDLWDMWWRAAGNEKPGEEARRPEEVLPLDDGEGRVVEPALIRDAYSTCDSDLAILLSPQRAVRDHASAVDVEGRLTKQIDWQLRRLCQSNNPLCMSDRAVLYELLRLHQLLLFDVEWKLPVDSVGRLVEDAKEFNDSIATFGETPLPGVSDAVFLNEVKENMGDGHERECTRIVDALLVIFAESSNGPDCGLETLPGRLRKAALSLEFLNDSDDGSFGDEKFEAIVRRMLQFWATRSRILRHALNDLLEYEFLDSGREWTETKSPPAFPRGPATGCDCWIAVIGHRRAGKTSFMNALTAALLPDDADLDDETKLGEFWSKSKAQLLMTSAFSEARTRADALKESKGLEEGLLGPWLTGQVQPTTTTVESRNMIDVDTAYLARIRFFDLAGEHMYDDATGNPDIHVQRMLEDRKPAATIIVDDNNPTRTAEDESRASKRKTSPKTPDDGMRDSDRTKYLDLVQDRSAPIYIIVNKCDYFLEEYVGDAEREMRESLSYTHDEPPAEYDVEHEADNIPFFSLRDIDLRGEGVNHQTVIERLRDLPSLARRPHYSQRVIRDLKRLDWLFDGLLERGARDITLVHLVLKRDGRRKPEEFSGLRVFWKEIETRLVNSTKNERRQALRSLLVDLPVEMEESATDAFGVFDGDWWKIAETGTGSQPERSEGFRSVSLRVRRKIDAYETRRSSKEEDRNRVQAAGALRSFQDLLERLVLESSGGDKSMDDVAGRLMLDLDGILGFLLERRGFHDKLREGIDQLLLEMGINPELQLKDIGALASVRQTTSEERHRVESLVKKLEHELPKLAIDEKLQLDDSGTLTEELRRLLGAVVQGDAGGEGNKEEGRRVKYDFREGAMRPFGSSAGSPLLDGSLSLDERDRLSEVAAARNQSIREAIFSTVGEAEPGLLVRCLYNVVQSQRLPTASRYPALTLRQGELDFCRVRVLSESPLLPLSDKFRSTALEVLKSLLEADKVNQEFDDNVVANAGIAEAIHGALSGFHLKPVVELIAGRDGQEGEDGGDGVESVVKSLTELEGGLSRWLSRGYLYKPGKRREELQEVWQEHQDLWSASDPGSARAPFKGLRIGRRRLHDAVSRISARKELLAEFQRAVNAARSPNDGIASEDGFVRKIFRNRSRTVLGNARALLDTDLTVPRKLIDLRIMRRLLIGRYVVRYLQIADWINTACEVAERDKNTEVEEELRKARAALRRMNMCIDEAQKEAESLRNRTMGDDIGSPGFDHLHVTGNDSFLRFDDNSSNWKALVEALGLVEIGTEENGAKSHPIWGGPQ